MRTGYWFYLPGLTGYETQALLSEPQASHAVRSRRLKVGDPLWLFNGSGHIAAGRISDIVQRPLEVHIDLQAGQELPAPRRRIHLLSALPKNERQVTMLDMATQLGMTDFTVLVCERSVSHMRERGLSRWQRVVIEACKQSHQSWLPVIHPPMGIETLVAKSISPDAVVLLADRGGHSAAQVSPLIADASVIYLLVGPEGGFTAGERDQLTVVTSASVSLGDSVLRIETAAVAMVSLAGSACLA